MGVTCSSCLLKPRHAAVHGDKDGYDDLIDDHTCHLLKLRGYKLVHHKKNSSAVIFGPGEEHQKAKHHETMYSDSVRAWLSSKDEIPLEILEKTFKDRGDRWNGHPQLFMLLAKRLRKTAQVLFALDVLRAGILTRCESEDGRALKLLLAQTLAQVGTTREAIVHLKELIAAAGGSADSESYGALARCYKDLAERATSDMKKRRFIRKALSVYEASFNAGGRRVYYVGINTATMLFLLGRISTARQVAEEVRQLCVAEAGGAEGGGGGDYWLLATLGEAFLILGNIPAARAHYGRAVQCAPGDYSRLISTRKQMLRLRDTYRRYDAASLHARRAVEAVVEEERRFAAAVPDTPADHGGGGDTPLALHRLNAHALAQRQRQLSRTGSPSPGSRKASLVAGVALEDEEKHSLHSPAQQQWQQGQGQQGQGQQQGQQEQGQSLQEAGRSGSLTAGVDLAAEERHTPESPSSKAATAEVTPGDGSAVATTAAAAADGGQAKGGGVAGSSFSFLPSQQQQQQEGGGGGGSVEVEMVNVPEGLPTLDSVFHIPAVVCFSSPAGWHHALDVRRSALVAFQLRLRAALQSSSAGFGFTRLSSPQELVFAEEMLGRGGEAHIALPLTQPRFVRQLADRLHKAWTARQDAARRALDAEGTQGGDSNGGSKESSSAGGSGGDAVSYLAGGGEEDPYLRPEYWTRRVKTILRKASKVIVCNDVGLNLSAVNHDYAGFYSHGLALRKAADMAGDLVRIACQPCTPLHTPRRGGEEGGSGGSGGSGSNSATDTAAATSSSSTSVGGSGGGSDVVLGAAAEPYTAVADCVVEQWREQRETYTCVPLTCHRLPEETPLALVEPCVLRSPYTLAQAQATGSATGTGRLYTPSALPATFMFPTGKPTPRPVAAAAAATAATTAEPVDSNSSKGLRRCQSSPRMSSTRRSPPPAARSVSPPARSVSPAVRSVFPTPTPTAAAAASPGTAGAATDFASSPRTPRVGRLPPLGIHPSSPTATASSPLYSLPRLSSRQALLASQNEPASTRSSPSPAGAAAASAASAPSLSLDVEQAVRDDGGADDLRSAAFSQAPLTVAPAVCTYRDAYFPLNQPLPLGCPPPHQIVALPSLMGSEGSAPPPPPPFALAGIRAETVAQQLKGIIFADVTGYSKLGEKAVVNFVGNVIAGVDRLIGELPVGRRPVVRNTWGDAFYFVFNTVADAGTFALTLSDFVVRTDWSDCDLPNSLNIRVSLHAAPLFPVWDAVIGAINYTGCHTSRAARIEPVTPPGSVYCSQAFAALSAAARVKEYSATYVGNMPLAKKYGEQPVFYVFWAQSSALRTAAAATASAAEAQDNLSFRYPPVSPSPSMFSPLGQRMAPHRSHSFGRTQLSKMSLNPAFAAASSSAVAGAAPSTIAEEG